MCRRGANQGLCFEGQNVGWYQGDDGKWNYRPMVVNNQTPFHREKRIRLFDEGMSYYEAYQKLLNVTMR